MNPNKIAVLVDSCTDVSPEQIKEYGMYFVPVNIIFSDGEYRDKVDISIEEIYDRLPTEIPRTSLPGGDVILETLNQIKSDGYEKLIIVSISSALSGTCNMMRIVSEDYEGLDIRVIDTRSIGYGAGAQAVLAAELIRKGYSFEAIVEALESSLRDSRVYFCLSTLEYLARGGRIGKVAAVLGSLLKIKPIITCNPEGAYVVAAKVRGRTQAISETVQLAVAQAKKHISCSIAVVDGNAREEAARVMQQLKKLVPNCVSFVEGTVGPALGVHTGPGLLGLMVQAIPAME